MKRRHFIVAAGAPLALSGLLTPITSQAGEPSEINNFAGSLFLTKENPGRWATKVSSHLPEIQLFQNDLKTDVKVITNHSFTGYKHYIIKHMLFDGKFQFINEHLFNPIEDDRATSNFSLDNYKGRLYAVSVCNKHDSWLTEIDIS